MGAKRLCALGAGLGASFGPAAAYDGEYVTYGGFDAVVEAFRYIALFFNHTEYGGLVFTFASIGFALGAVNAFFRSNRDVTQFIIYAVAFIFGAGFFSAFVLPKGNVNVFDPTRNATATVAGVPDGIVIVATLASNIQETAVFIADAASPRLYQDTANGTIYDVVRASLGAGDPFANQFLLESTKAYYLDCVSLATRLPGTGLTVDELKNTSTDLIASFAKAQSESNFTVLYSSAAPGGATASCTAAWAAIEPQLSGAATYAAYEDAICTQADFDAADPVQKARCQVVMDEIPVALFQQAAGDRFSYMRAAALAHAMEEAMADINPERAIAAETNRRFAEQASGFFVIANEYGPFIRAAFLAAALSTLPLLFLFIMTPFMGAVLRLFIGFFAFVTLWSVIDVGIAQVAHGIAVDAFEDVARHEIAYSALMLSPPASAKALAVFGATRFIAISFAALFVVTVFKISGASFAAITGPIQSAATGAGDAAASAVMNPVGRISGAMSNANAAGAGAALGSTEGGFGDIRNMNAFGAGRTMGQGRAVAERAGAGNVTNAGRASGVMAGAGEFGAVTGAAVAGGVSHSAVMAGEAGAFGAIGGAAQTRGKVDTATAMSRAAMTSDLAGAVASSSAANGGADEVLKRVGGHSAYRDMAPLMAAGGDLDRAGGATVTAADRALGSTEGFAAGAAGAGFSTFGASEARAQLDGAFAGGEARWAAGASKSDMEAVTQGGALRRDRQVGWVDGINQGANHIGAPAGEASRQAESFNAANAIIAASVMRDVGQRHFGDQNAMFAAQAGANRTFTPTNSDWAAMRESGAISESAYQFGREHGADLSVSFDGEGNAQNYHVGSRASMSRDEMMEFRGGESIQAAPSVTGDTLFNWAFGGARGVSQFTQMAERYEAAGTEEILRDNVSMAAARHLSGLSADDMSTSESGSYSASGSVYGDVSGGTPSPASLFGVSARFGARGELGSSDASEARRVQSFDANLAATQSLWDRTMDNDSIGDMGARTNAYFDGLRTLDVQAHERQDAVHGKAVEPDGFFGDRADAFASKDQEVTDEEFQELLRRTRFRQPGEM
ncbi:MAG: conjugal transfer protein TraG N-terminal domain-containing protein [Pseudomonadota bacterium]